MRSMSSALELYKSNERGMLFGFLAITLSGMVGVLVSIVPSPFVISAVSLSILAIPVYSVRPEIGLYAIVFFIPLQYLEIVIGTSVGVSWFDLVLWPWILACGVRLLFLRRGLQRSKVYPLILAWILASLASGVATRDLSSWAIAVVSRLIQSAALVLIYNELSLHRKTLRRVTDLYICMGVVVAMLGILQFIGAIPSHIVDPFSGTRVGTTDDRRVGGLLPNPNSMAAYLSVPMFLSLARFSSTRGNGRYGYLLVSLVLTMTIIFTVSRAAFGAIVVAGVVVFINRKRMLRKLILGIVVVTLLAGVFYVVFERVYANTGYSGSFGALVQGDVAQMDRSARDRLVFARMAFDMFRSSPVVGVGAGQYAAELLRFRVPEYRYDVIYNAHNTYLEILADTGIVGLVSFVLLFGMIFLEAVRARRRSTAPVATLTGVLAGFVALCVYALAHQMIRSEIWLVAGFLLACTKMSDVELGSPPAAQKTTRQPPENCLGGWGPTGILT